MAAFTSTPDYVYEEEISYSTLVTEFENRSEQRRTKWSAPRRRFVLQFRNKTLAEMQSDLAFFQARLGAYDSFTFTNPNNSTLYNVRYVDDTFKVTNHAYQIYSYQMEFVTV